MARDVAATRRDAEVAQTNRRDRITPVGRVLFGALDRVGVATLVGLPGGAHVVALALGAALYAAMFAAGVAFRAGVFGGGPGYAFPSAIASLDDGGALLAPIYGAILAAAERGLPPWLGAAGPMFPSVVALGTYGAVVAAFTAVDCARGRAVRERMFQPAPAAFFGGAGLGLRRVLATHARFLAALLPVYAYLLANDGPSLYPAPWCAPCEGGCGAAGWALPAVAPPLFECALHLAWCLVAMDAAYWYWHWMQHKYRPMYRAIHAMHHEYHAPFALVTQHAHPIEIAVTGGFSIVAPLAIGAHPLTMWLWLVLSVTISIDAHSGCVRRRPRSSRARAPLRPLAHRRPLCARHGATLQLRRAARAARADSRRRRRHGAPRRAPPAAVGELCSVSRLPRRARGDGARLQRGSGAPRRARRARARRARCQRRPPRRRRARMTAPVRAEARRAQARLPHARSLASPARTPPLVPRSRWARLGAPGTSTMEKRRRRRQAPRGAEQLRTRLHPRPAYS
jgi:sterol desaturase/sphingolipid hydroxylase (fatty acid hydroxylase superfamily)